MSLLTSPILTGYLDTQLSNLNYIFRGAVRLNGESVGLPQAVPDDRKLDYFLRDCFMVMTTPFTTEFSYRLIESGYVIPNFINLLQLNQLNKIYPPQNIHTPEFAKKLAIQNYTKSLPPILEKHMLGNLVNPRSYYSIPDLLEEQIIPSLQKSKASPEEVLQTRLWAHHLRRILNSNQYLEKFLKPKIGESDTTLLKNHLSHVENIASQFEKIVSQIKKGQFTISGKEALEILKQKKAQKLLALLNKNEEIAIKEIESALEKTSTYKNITHLLFNSFKEGPVRSWQAFSRTRTLAAHPLVAQLHQYPPEAVHKLYDTLQTYLRHPVMQESQSPVVANLRKVLSSKHAFAKAVEGPSFSVFFKNIRKMGVKRAYQFYKNLTLYASPADATGMIRQHVLLPLVQAEHGANSHLARLFSDLSLNQVTCKRLYKVFEGSGFWLKLPFSILTSYLVCGMIFNTLDNKVIQPYQRELVKQRGTTREFLVPGFIGVIPGIAAFALCLKLPWVKRLGYARSFGLAGLACILANAASAMAMFKYRLYHSPPPGKPADLKTQQAEKLRQLLQNSAQGMPYQPYPKTTFAAQNHPQFTSQFKYRP